MKTTLKQLSNLMIIGLLSPAVAAEPNNAAQFIVFFDKPDKDCEERGGQRSFVKNSHAEQMIDLHLDRYFYGVRQAERSMFPLAAGDEQALGCNRVFDAEQRWELVSAAFITPDAAEQRYGQYQLYYRD